MKSNGESNFAIRKARIVTAERIQFSIRSDDVRAAAVDPVFVPGPCIHERLDEDGTCWFRRVQVSNSSPSGSDSQPHFINLRGDNELCPEGNPAPCEVNKVADGMGATIRFEQVTNRGAIRITAGQQCEIFKPELAVRLFNRGQNDVGVFNRSTQGSRPAFSRTRPPSAAPAAVWNSRLARGRPTFPAFFRNEHRLKTDAADVLYCRPIRWPPRDVGRLSGTPSSRA
jgi:hypothetical protein